MYLHLNKYSITQKDSRRSTTCMHPQISTNLWRACGLQTLSQARRLSEWVRRCGARFVDHNSSYVAQEAVDVVHGFGCTVSASTVTGQHCQPIHSLSTDQLDTGWSDTASNTCLQSLRVICRGAGSVQQLPVNDVQGGIRHAMRPQRAQSLLGLCTRADNSRLELCTVSNALQ